MLTKNSMPYVRESIPSVYRAIPLNHLILVDGGSTDGTLEYARTFPDVKVIMDTGTRATARQRGIEHVETEWHVHVDSDVILCEDWMGKARPYIDDATAGAVWGVTIPLPKVNKDIVRALAKLYRISPIEMQRRQERYLLTDTAIRTAAVSGIVIPPDRHVQEDQFIGEHIVTKGYSFLKVSEPYCYHRLAGRSESGLRREAVLSGYVYHKYQMKPFSSILRNALSAMPKAIWIFLYTLNFSAMRRFLFSQTLPLEGWLMCDSKKVVERAPNGKR
jgi:glycosyltransferase involved in cell wall biosynthesis